MVGGKIKSNFETEETELWKTGTFIQSKSMKDIEQIDRTIYKKHD